MNSKSIQTDPQHWWPGAERQSNLKQAPATLGMIWFSPKNTPGRLYGGGRGRKVFTNDWKLLGGTFVTNLDCSQFELELWDSLTNWVPNSCFGVFGVVFIGWFSSDIDTSKGPMMSVWLFLSFAITFGTDDWNLVLALERKLVILFESVDVCMSWEYWEELSSFTSCCLSSCRDTVITTFCVDVSCTKTGKGPRALVFWEFLFLFLFDCECDEDLMFSNLVNFVSFNFDEDPNPISGLRILLYWLIFSFSLEWLLCDTGWTFR